MKTLLKYELFKVISDRFFIISLVSLLLLNILSCSFSLKHASSADLQDSLIQLFQDYNNDPDSIFDKIRERSDFEETQRKYYDDKEKNLYSNGYPPYIGTKYQGKY